MYYRRDHVACDLGVAEEHVRLAGTVARFARDGLDATLSEDVATRDGLAATTSSHNGTQPGVKSEAREFRRDN